MSFGVVSICLFSSFPRRTFVQSLKIVELRGEAALAGGVDDQHDLALHVGEREGRALVIFGLEVVEAGGGRHGACCGGECVCGCWCCSWWW